jgi:hypothetical protein
VPETKYTTNRGIPYPTGKDFVPEGPAEMEAIATALDAENRGELDYLQAGIVKTSDWSFTAAMENSGTCALESEAEVAESICWLTLTAIGLVRSVTAKGKLKGLKPPSLPGPGKYLSVGIELTPTTSDAAATVAIVSGVEKGTQAEAEAAPAGPVAGKLRIRNVVVKNTAGVYSIVSQEDVRPWATGGFVTAAYGAETEREIGEEYEPSATHTTIVLLSITATGTAELTVSVFVGGSEVQRGALGKAVAGQGRIPFTVPVPVGAKWKVVADGGNQLFSTYVTM